MEEAPAFHPEVALVFVSVPGEQETPEGLLQMTSSPEGGGVGIGVGEVVDCGSSVAMRRLPA